MVCSLCSQSKRGRIPASWVGWFSCEVRTLFRCKLSPLLRQRPSVQHIKRVPVWVAPLGEECPLEEEQPQRQPAWLDLSAEWEDRRQHPWLLVARGLRHRHHRRTLVLPEAAAACPHREWGCQACHRTTAGERDLARKDDFCSFVTREERTAFRGERDKVCYAIVKPKSSALPHASTCRFLSETVRMIEMKEQRAPQCALPAALWWQWTSNKSQSMCDHGKGLFRICTETALITRATMIYRDPHEKVSAYQAVHTPSGRGSPTCRGAHGCARCTR